MNFTCTLSDTHKLTIESQRSNTDFVVMILVSEENMSSAFGTVKEYVTNYKTYILGQSLGTTMSNLKQPKSKE